MFDVQAVQARYARDQMAKRLGVHPKTLDRWRKSGVEGVRLAPLMLGGRYYYTDEIVESWQAAVARKRAARLDPPPAPTRAQRRAGREYARAKGIAP